MKFKKTIVLIISIVLISCCTVSGTLALPSISDIFKEIFGNIQEPTDETQLTFDVQLNIHEIKGELLYPGKAYTREVAVKNSETSEVPIYCWLTYSVPKPLTEKYGSKGVAPLTIQFANDSRWQTNTKSEKVMIEGKPYVQYTCIYNEPLEIGKTTPLCMKSISLDVHVNRDSEGYFYWDEEGVDPTRIFNSNELTIPITAYAVNATEVDLKMIGVNPDVVVTSD